MSTPAILAFDTLLAPIPGDSPAGAPLPFAIKEKLEEARKEINPDDFAPDDPMRPDNPKFADWNKIILLASEALENTSKDLLVAARLTEALTKQHGFAGLRDGLQFMRRLLEEAWDRIIPVIETDEDLELRAGPFNWLDDPDRGARFPNTIRNVPLLWLGETGYGWNDWKKSSDPNYEKAGELKENFEKALSVAPPERCRTIHADLTEAIQELSLLFDVLGQKLGQYAPGLTSLRQALTEVKNLMDFIVQRKGVEEGVGKDEGAAAEGSGEGETGSSGGGRAPNSRTEIYRQLGRLATALRAIEPHSPIPYLLERAVALGELPFPKLIAALIRDVNTVSELYREFGIPEEQPQ